MSVMQLSAMKRVTDSGIRRCRGSDGVMIFKV